MKIVNGESDLLMRRRSFVIGRYFLSHRSEIPEQFCATGWVNGRTYSLVFEIRRDKEGEFYHLVTLWKATKEEIALYEENA